MRFFVNEHSLVGQRRSDILDQPSGKWEYAFFIDIEGHVEDAGVAATLVISQV